ncbi:hypothetical protein [Nonomuraea sp. KM88]|uniref:hypothetical protein n=1 Tax=Nonomuraea sp. KM88 TaxID=3457427 RepID=UPI003FCE908B
MFRRRVLPLAGLAFVAFYLFSRPEAAAASINGVVDRILGGADNLAVFLAALLG